jgi:hypothetical protein
LQGPGDYVRVAGCSFAIQGIAALAYLAVHGVAVFLLVAAVALSRLRAMSHVGWALRTRPVLTGAG